MTESKFTKHEIALARKAVLRLYQRVHPYEKKEVAGDYRTILAVLDAAAYAAPE